MLLTADDCAAALGLEVEALEPDWATAAEAAEAAVSAYMCGEPQALSANTTHTETVYPSGRSRDIPLVYGPVSALGTVKLNGATLSNTPRVRYALKTLYGLTLPPQSAYDRPINRGDELEVTYTRGWTPASVPAWLKAALLAEFVERYNAPGEEVKAEKLGDFQVTYGDRSSRGHAVKSADARARLVGSRSWQVAGAS